MPDFLIVHVLMGVKITPMAKAVLAVKLLLGISSVAVMVFAGIRSRVLRERMLRKLLPDEKDIRRLPPYYSVDPSAVPDTPEGKEYISYCNKINKQSLRIFCLALVPLAIAYFFPVRTSNW